jgi:predicted RNase H-like nuclease
VASAKVQGTVFAPEEPVRLDHFVDVLDQRPGYSTIALNAPVGYLSQAAAGGRSCDRETRQLLGRRGGAVKNAPVRLDSRREIDLLPEHADAITKVLLPRYREVANEMLSFFQLNGEVPMRWSKRSEKGVAERRALLEAKVQGSMRILDADVRGAYEAHLIDAAAILWTARRIHARAVTRIPVDPEWDDQGLRMELVR